MSLHAIFLFQEMTKSGLPSVAGESDTDCPPQVISAAWRATTETLRASLSDKSERDAELEFT